MVRPLKADRESVAITTVRVSSKTKQLLQDLQRLHNFKTMDSVLQFYINEKTIANQANFHTAREIRDLTQPNIDKMIKGAASEVMKKINNVNKYGPRQSRLKSKPKPKPK